MPNTENTTLVLCDLDHTLVMNDTLFSVLYAIQGRWQTWMNLVRAFFQTLRAKKKSFSTLKEKLLALSLWGKDYSHTQDRLRQQWLEKQKKKINPDILKIIHTYANFKVVIVSASLGLWVELLAKELGFDFIATHFRCEGSRLADGFAGENCKGKEKVRRIRETLGDLSSYSKIVALGDSPSDYPMYKLADEVYHRGKKLEK